MIKCTQCFKSLGISTRFKLYQHLQKHGKSKVSDLVAQAHVAQSTCSYHLKEMQEHGLVKSEHQGKYTYYEINHVCPHYAQTCVMEGINFKEN